MNKVTLMGRLVREPDVRYTQGQQPLAIAKYTLAVDRKYKKDGEPTADFINCVAFGKNGEFAEKYLHKGIKIAVCGRIQTGSYTNKDGNKVYTTDVVVEEHDFAESRNAGQAQQKSGEPGNRQPETRPMPTEFDGFADIPDGIDETLPFK